MNITVVECPRDAMQGFKNFIPTQVKIEYLNHLLTCGFDVLDCGSFVSEKAIPQMADTPEVLSEINPAPAGTKLLVIVANERGATNAAAFQNIHYLGFPFSVSEEFQIRNTNKTRQEAYTVLQNIQHIASDAGKEVVCYISMGFGNPYKEPWSVELVAEWVEKIVNLGITTIALSDTVGMAKPQDIKLLFTQLIPAYPQVSFGAHFHTRPDNWQEKVEAAFEAGCRRFDGAIKGFGGCPMASDSLTGNLPTENLLYYAAQYHITHAVKQIPFEQALEKAEVIFG